MSIYNEQINPNAQRVDTHHHMVPDFYRTWLLERGVSAGGKAIPRWSMNAALDFMDATGVRTAIASISTPGVEPALPGDVATGDLSEARYMARKVNEFGADLRRQHPDRFGFFATLTLPDITGSLQELEYSLDELGADGVVLLANTRGVYLGDPMYEELMAELNHRGAVVFVHPSHLPAKPVPGIAPYVADFLLDTTRAAANLVHNGVMDRYTRLKIILSHAGGFVPFAAGRMAANIIDHGDQEHGIRQLRRFYFDTALSSTKYGLPSLLAFADPERVLYGSDFPYAAPERSAWFTGELDSYSEIDSSAINNGNAARLFPRLAKQVILPG